MDYTTKEYLRALRWLANHARDPRISDGAYLSLAGLRLEHDSGPLPGSSTANLLHSALSKFWQESGIRTSSLLAIFVDICNCLNQARRGSPQELAASFDTNVARYASTLPQIVDYLKRHYDRRKLAKVGARFVGAEMEVGSTKQDEFEQLNSLYALTVHVEARDSESRRYRRLFISSQGGGPFMHVDI